MSTIKVSQTPASQPCRALMWFLRRNKLPHEAVTVDILKGENLTPEYTAKTPYQAVPIAEYEGEVLTETGAIMIYLAQTHKLTNEYPTDLKGQFRVNEALLHHQTLARQIAGLVVRPLLVKLHKPETTGEQLKGLIAANSGEIKYVLGLLDTLLSKSEFITGPTWTLADYLVLAEATQVPAVAPFLPADISLSNYPHLTRYLEHAKTLEGYEEFMAPLTGFTTFAKSWLA